MVQQFCGKFVEEGGTIAEDCAKAAMETVEKHLGYDPELKEYTVSVYGDGSETLALPAWISELKSVHCFDETTAYEWEKNYLYRAGRKAVWEKGVLYTVRFSGGFDPVPMKIALVAKQLASLYWESAGGNLAVSSTSYADTGTRVFNNFSEERFLKDIDAWRIQRL